MWMRMTGRHMCGVWIFLQLWRGITGQSYSVQVSSSVRVQEGLCVTIPCTFTADGRNTFRNSFGYWIRMPHSIDYIVATNDKSSDVKKTNFHLTGNPDTGDCTLTITGARKEDAGEYYFRFDENKNNPVKYSYIKEITSITVPDLTEEPVIWDVGTLTAGIAKTVTCAPPGNCPVTSLVIQWKKSDVSGIWKNSPNITFTPSLDDHQKTITCEMTNSKGKTTQKTIVLDVCYLTEEPVISDVGTMISGVDKTLTCTPIGNCSKSSIVIQWKKSDVSGIWKNSPTITFTPSLDDHQKTITCEMTNSIGRTTQKAIVLDVCNLSGEPVISDLEIITAGINQTVTCAPSGNCPVTSFTFQWKKSDVSGIWKNSPNITFTPSPDDHQKTITCEMTISEGKTTQKSILLHVYLPLLEDPKFIIGLSTGGAIICLVILLGIVFLVRRNKKNQPSEPRALTRDRPARMKAEEKGLPLASFPGGSGGKPLPVHPVGHSGKQPASSVAPDTWSPDDLYENTLAVRPSEESHFTMKAIEETEDNIYANV